MNNANIKKISIKDIAEEIFEGKLTWNEACEKFGISEKTLRKNIIELCNNDSELLEMATSYKKNRLRHDNINVSNVIIYMIKKQMSLSEMATELKISKESLRALIKKENNEDVLELLKYHNSIMKQKRKRDIKENQYINEKIENYKKEHQDNSDLLFYNENQIEYEVEDLKRKLNKVEALREAGMSDKEICQSNNWGMERIRRMKLKYKKLLLIKSKQATENKIEKDER